MADHDPLARVAGGGQGQVDHRVRGRRQVQGRGAGIDGGQIGGDRGDAGQRRLGPRKAAVQRGGLRHRQTVAGQDDSRMRRGLKLGQGGIGPEELRKVAGRKRDGHNRHNAQHHAPKFHSSSPRSNRLMPD